jgi:hypothetical protein
VNHGVNLLIDASAVLNLIVFTDLQNIFQSIQSHLNKLIVQTGKQVTERFNASLAHQVPYHSVSQVIRWNAICMKKYDRKILLSLINMAS